MPTTATPQQRQNHLTEAADGLATNPKSRDFVHMTGARVAAAATGTSQPPQKKLKKIPLHKPQQQQQQQQHIMMTACTWRCRAHLFPDFAEGACAFNAAQRAAFNLDARMLRLVAAQHPSRIAEVVAGPDDIGGAQFGHLLQHLSSVFADLIRAENIRAYVETVATLPGMDLRVVDAHQRSGLLRIAELGCSRLDVEQAWLLGRKSSLRALSNDLLAWLVLSQGYSADEVEAAKAQAEQLRSNNNAAAAAGHHQHQQARAAACLFPHHVHEHPGCTVHRLRSSGSSLLREARYFNNRGQTETLLHLALRPWWRFGELKEVLRFLVDEAGVDPFAPGCPSLLERSARLSFYDAPELRQLLTRLARTNEERSLAVAMALHPRLGADARLGQLLGADALRMCAPFWVTWPSRQ